MEILISESNPAKAKLYLRALKESGISAMLTNESMAGLIPVIDSGFIIKVPAEELAEAKKIIREYQDILNQKVEEDFHYADKEDIQYEKELNDSEAAEKKVNNKVGLIFIIFLVFVLYFTFLYSK